MHKGLVSDINRNIIGCTIQSFKSNRNLLVINRCWGGRINLTVPTSQCMKGDISAWRHRNRRHVWQCNHRDRPCLQWRRTCLRCRTTACFCGSYQEAVSLWQSLLEWMGRYPARCWTKLAWQTRSRWGEYHGIMSANMILICKCPYMLHA